jgi:hypothetical protein
VRAWYRRGTVQAMGNNLYALMKGLSRAPELNKPPVDLPNPKAVFWDFLGYFQVRPRVDPNANSASAIAKLKVQYCLCGC